MFSRFGRNVKVKIKSRTEKINLLFGSLTACLHQHHLFPISDFDVLEIPNFILTQDYFEMKFDNRAIQEIRL